MAQNDINQGRRRFLVTATTLLGAIGAFFSAIPFISSWLPNARTKALGGPVEADISHLTPGALLVVEWRGKPVWIIRRTQKMLTVLTKDRQLLRDPDSKVEQQPPYAKNSYRSVKPEILVLIGICTHLGCSPTYKPSMGELGPDWPGGFYCPCHGSKFDLAGRVFKGVPAPINLEVPPYHFIGENTLLIGEETKDV
jgi:ubiquinol-cytochrome c reductase iron-sulfur subunit